MVPKWGFAILGFLFYVSALEKVDLDSSIRWSELEYEDACGTAANATWEFLKNPTNHTLDNWVTN